VKRLNRYRRLIVKKTFLLIVALCVLAVPAAFAQLRADIGINAPFLIGIEAPNLGAEGESVKIPAFLPIPYVQLAYNFDLGQINLGVGLKAYTAIIASMLYPVAYVEFDADPITVSASVGGGFYAFLVLTESIADFAPLIIPDVSINYRLGKSFRLGLSALTFYFSEIDQQVFPYAVYFSAKFTLDF